MQSDRDEEADRHRRDDLAQHTAEARAERALKIGIALFSGCLLLAITLSIQLSTLGLTFGSVVHGGDPVWPGHTATFRAGALDAQTSRLVPGVHVTARLVDQSGVRATAEAIGDELAEVHLDVPADLGATAEVELDLHSPLGDDTVRVPLQVERAPRRMAARLANNEETWIEEAKKPSGRVRVALYPHSGHAVAGLENPITGRVTRDGAPLATHVVCKEAHVDTHSDAAGLFTFSFRPPLKPQSLVFRVGDESPASVGVPLDFRPSQLRAELLPGRLLTPGSEAHLRVHTLPFRTPVHVDVWVGDVLLHGATAAAARGLLDLPIPIPADVRGLMRVDVYKSVWDPASNLSSVAAWVSPAPPLEACNEALDALRQLPGGDPILAVAAAASGDERLRACGLALGRVEAVTPGMPLLRSNIAERRARVAAEVDALRGQVHAFGAAVVILGLLFIVAWVIRHQLQMRRNVRSAMEEGIAAGDAGIEAEHVAGLTKFGHAYDLALVFAALLLAVYGIYMLVTRIRWF